MVTPICANLKFPRVSARVSEAIILRSYPFQEADLVVSFLTRDQGKLRGVARRARRPKSPFGAGLERLSQVRVAYFQRPARELVNLDSCELICSQFGLAGDYGASVALDYLAEVTDQLLPPAEPNERYFRLLNAVLDHLRSGEPGSLWRAVTYFTLWAVRLSGFLPEVGVCAGCGAGLQGGAFFTRGRPGLLCASCRRTITGAAELSEASRGVALSMQRLPVSQVEPGEWPREMAGDLREYLIQQIESQIERKLITAPMLAAV